MSARPWDLTQAAFDFGGDSIAGFLIGIVALVALCFVLPIVFLLLITGVEWLVLLVLLPVALLGRLLFGKHWTIEVRHDGSLWEIDGGTWRESQAKFRQIAAQIQGGEAPAPDTAVA
jgi:hypothetical protein